MGHIEARCKHMKRYVQEIGYPMQTKPLVAKCRNMRIIVSYCSASVAGCCFFIAETF